MEVEIRIDRQPHCLPSSGPEVFRWSSMVVSIAHVYRYSHCCCITPSSQVAALAPTVQRRCDTNGGCPQPAMAWGPTSPKLSHPRRTIPASG